MRVLFDQGTPIPLRRAPTGHPVFTAFEMGWAALENGQLLDVAEAAFDVPITTDQNLRYQQNLTSRHLAILVLPTTSWPVIQTPVAEVVADVNELRAGEFRELGFSE